jgi:BirA family biotin operon repressor/biotin-[acetyl-CoA-carboxylase] ligase
MLAVTGGILLEDTIERIADILEIGEYVPVPSLKAMLGCTQSELRDYLSSMREKGYEIEENPTLGVRLLRDPDVLSEKAIRTGLQTRILGNVIQCFSSLGSTNEKAKELGREGMGEGCVVAADEQTAGRGRFGRTWLSPKGEGIWMSIILRPASSLEPVAALSLVAAHSVATGLREVTGVRTAIKWPNDVKVGGKKVCGILGELDKDSTGAGFLVMGIGVNVNQTCFTGDLESYATSVRIETGKVFTRPPLVRKILENLERSYLKAMQDGLGQVLKEVRRLCTMVGEQVSVHLGTEEIKGYVQDIDDSGRLIVRTDEGKIREILAGEASRVR